MRLVFALAMVSLCTGRPGAAQDYPGGPRAEFGIEATRWVFDVGNYSYSAQARWGPTVQFGLRPRVGSRVSALLSVMYASQGDFEPGTSGAGLELAVRIARVGEKRRRLNGFITGGLNILNFNADRQEANEPCTVDNGCLDGGVSFRSGWRTVLAGGLGADLPIAPSLLLQPQAQVLKPIGGGRGGPTNGQAMLRFGLGLVWR